MTIIASFVLQDYIKPNNLSRYTIETLIKSLVALHVAVQFTFIIGMIQEVTKALGIRILHVKPKEAQNEQKNEKTNQKEQPLSNSNDSLGTNASPIKIKDE